MRGFDLHGAMARATFAGEATLRGRLVSLGRYPGFMDGEGTVRGELYRFDDAAAALEVLDDIEGYDPANPLGGSYVREARLVNTSDGSTHTAWVYRFIGDATGLETVPRGDWRAATRK